MCKKNYLPVYTTRPLPSVYTRGKVSSCSGLGGSRPQGKTTLGVSR